MRRFTQYETRLLLSAIRIACEDGSIYGGSDDDAAAVKKINDTLDSAVRKIREATLAPR